MLGYIFKRLIMKRSIAASVTTEGASSFDAWGILWPRASEHGVSRSLFPTCRYVYSIEILFVLLVCDVLKDAAKSGVVSWLYCRPGHSVGH